MRRAFAIPIFALLMALGANVEVPLGEVPFILADFFVLLAGLLLGGWQGGLAVLLYLLAGFAGLPVFAGGSSGIERLSSPTGGYLVGYLLAAMVAGKIAYFGGKHYLRDAMATLSGQAVLFACGLAGLTMAANMRLGEAVEVGLYPFLVPIFIKFVAAVLCAWLLRPLMNGPAR